MSVVPVESAESDVVDVRVAGIEAGKRLAWTPQKFDVRRADSARSPEDIPHVTPASHEVCRGIRTPAGAPREPVAFHLVSKTENDGAAPVLRGLRVFPDIRVEVTRNHVVPQEGCVWGDHRLPDDHRHDAAATKAVERRGRKLPVHPA